ncbi:MAG: S8 family serine peptidase, partial [Pirellulaceae bacterium]
MHLESLEQRVVLSGNAFDISGSGLVEAFDSEAERVTASPTSGDADGEYTGDGISVGVISDSAWNYGSSVETGGLPEGVVRVRDVYASDEGRAALEVVHQVAPDADLFFCSGYGGEVKFADAIRKLAEAGADIIVDDLTYYSEPFFQDGIISSAIAEVHAEHDILYVSASGNHGNNSYESMYRAGEEGLHDFDESEDVTTRQHFTTPALENDYEVRLVLQWNDPFYTEDQVVHDFDVFVYDSENNLVVSSEAENLSTQEPLEQLSLDIDAGQAEDYFLEITGHDVDPNDRVHLKYVLFGPEGMEIVSFATDNSTAVGHVMSDSVLSVGATDGENYELVNEYSSGGSSTVYYDADGVPFEEPRTRTGVEVVAATDATTGVSGFEEFGGTSAAAARVAGIAAAAWSSAPHLTSAQLRQVLKNSAIDLYEPGWDERSGHGRVEMDSAVQGAITVSDVLSPSVSGVSPGERSGWFVPKIAVVFSEPMDPTIAGNTSHYTLESSGSDDTWNTADDVTYAVSVKYVAVTNTVEISPETVSELPFGDYRVTLSSDLEDVAGNPLATSAGPTYEFSVDSGAPVFELPEAADARYSLSEDGKLVVSDVYNFSVGNENYYQLRTATVDPSGHAQPYQVLQTDPNADQLSEFAEATTNYIIYRFITIYVYGGGGGGGSSAPPVSTTPTVNINGNNGVISWSEIVGSTIAYHVQLLDSYGTPVGDVLDLETVDQYGSVPPNIISTDSHIIVHTLQKHSTENYNVTRIVIYDREGKELTSIVPFSGRASSNSKLYDRMILDGSGNIVISHLSDNVLRIASYSVDGTLLGTEEIASGVAVDWEQYSPVIVSCNNGDLLAAYWTISAIDDNLHLKVRRRDQATGSWGEPREIAISDEIRWVDLAVGDDGRFVVVWQNQNLSLLAQRFDPNLNAVDDVILVTQLANTSSADVLFHGTDRFVVVWQNQQNFSRWFMWDSIPETIDVGPWVTGFEVTETPDGLVDCQVHFDREMDWNVIVRQHFSIRAPNGVKVPIQQLVPSDDEKSVTLVFSHTWPIHGRYDLEVSHLVQDLAGRRLNQDGDGLNGEPDDDRYHGIWLYLPDESTPVPYVEDFNSGDFGTLGGWRFAVDSGVGFALDASSAMEGTHYLQAALGSGHSDAYARAGLVLDLSGWDGESELTLDYLSRRDTSYFRTEYALSVSGSGEADTWTSVLTNMEPVSETTEHHVVDLGSALEAAGIVPDGDVHVQWRFRLDHGQQTFGLDRVRVGSQDAMGAAVSSLTA